MSSDTRTGTAKTKLVEAIDGDLEELGEKLHTHRSTLSRLEEDGRGVNGLSSSCKAWGKQLDEILRGIEEEAERVKKLMLGTEHPEIKQSVDDGLKERVTEAKATEAKEEA